MAEIMAKHQYIRPDIRSDIKYPAGYRARYPRYPVRYCARHPVSYRIFSQISGIRPEYCIPLIHPSYAKCVVARREDVTPYAPRGDVIRRPFTLSLRRIHEVEGKDGPGIRPFFHPVSGQMKWRDWPDIRPTRALSPDIRVDIMPDISGIWL